MNAGRSIELVSDVAARRERTKARLYVLCQIGAWGGFLLVQLMFSRLFAQPEDQRAPLAVVASTTMVMSIGLLLTHFSRPLIERWNWKQLGWRALMPRVLALAAAQSFLWSALCYGYSYGLLRQPWPAKYSPALLLSLSWINGIVMLVGWLCLYLFYHLFDRLNRSEIERLRLLTSVKEAELRALKSQVNPHFIFNSLNSLRALIDENPARARQSVTQLANLLRYSLQSGQLETVPFEDELRVVNDYLALEQVRHEERLRIRLQISPETLALPVPPMLLQTLVENAVKYGISVRPEGGEIAIIAHCEHGALRLQVTNPGELVPTAAASVTSTGVGLRNAAERLRLLFGDRATLNLRSSAPSIVVAEAVMPLPATSG